MIHTKIIRSNDFEQLRELALDWCEKNMKLTVDFINLDTIITEDDIIFQVTIQYEEEE